MEFHKIRMIIKDNFRNNVIRKFNRNNDMKTRTLLLWLKASAYFVFLPWVVGLQAWVRACVYLVVLQRYREVGQNQQNQGRSPGSTFILEVPTNKRNGHKMTLSPEKRWTKTGNKKGAFLHVFAVQTALNNQSCWHFQDENNFFATFFRFISHPEVLFTAVYGCMVAWQQLAIKPLLFLAPGSFTFPTYLPLLCSH